MSRVLNMNDRSSNAPRLRVDINEHNVFGLPTTSTVPRGDDRTVLRAVVDAGFEGIQTNVRAAAARDAGLRCTGSARIDRAPEAERRAAAAVDAGCDCITVHVGTGLENDDEIDRLVEATLDASEKFKLPIYIETHRATITQDIWRTVKMIERFPEIRFNGDFSHYYTGLELVYGDLQAKFEFMQPIFDRVRFIHGRIGNGGCIQVDIGAGMNQKNVEHFKEMWVRSFAGFLKSAGPGDVICFTPELLQPQIDYARTFPDARGELVEESDRWQQAGVLAGIAWDCFQTAKTLKTGS